MITVAVSTLVTLGGAILLLASEGCNDLTGTGLLGLLCSKFLVGKILVGVSLFMWELDVDA